MPSFLAGTRKKSQFGQQGESLAVTELFITPFISYQLFWRNQNVNFPKKYSLQAQHSSSNANKSNLVGNISAVATQMWLCIFRKVSQFSPWIHIPLFCASSYVRYCEYSGVHRADSRAEAPSHAACSAVGTLCQPHRSLHTGRERSCHQVGAHRIVINAANSHLTAFICA